MQVPFQLSFVILGFILHLINDLRVEPHELLPLLRELLLDFKYVILERLNAVLKRLLSLSLPLVSVAFHLRHLLQSKLKGILLCHTLLFDLLQFSLKLYLALLAV